MMKIQTFAVASLLLGSLVSISNARPASKHSLTMMRSGTITNKTPNPIFYFRAHRGQKVSVSVSSPTREFYPLVFITSPSGEELIQYKQTSYSAKLPETGRYKVRVGVNLMATNALRGRYRLEVRVR